MKHALGLFGVVAASILLAVSAAMNWQFGFSLGKTEFDSQIFGLASVASDGLKALLPFFIFAAFKNRNWSQAVAGSALWGICLAFSLTSALGFAALNRTDTAGARTAQVLNYKDLRSELTRSRERLSWIPEHRPAGVVESAMAGVKQNKRWLRTKGCVRTKSSRSIAYCQGYHQLGAELAAAQEAKVIEQRITAIKYQLSQVPEGMVDTTGDPQATVLAQLSGQDEKLIQTGLIILIALLVELGSALGFYVVLSQWKIFDERMPIVVARPRTRGGANDNRNRSRLSAKLAPKRLEGPATTLPENDVERFQRERIEDAEGFSLTATALYEDYCDWCEDLGKETLALPTFGRQLSEMGFQKAKIAGRIRYFGIRLRPTEAEQRDNAQQAA